MQMMIFDVPAESGGALTILNQYYDKAVEDKANDYIFIVSVVDLKETDNIKILKYPWIKKSWLHRLFFDKFIASTIVKKFNPDKVLSLQNIMIPNINTYQILYVHQPLPFVNHKFKIRENFKYWIYQNIIGKEIKKSISKSNEVIVQTKWLKKEIESLNSNIKVISPKIKLSELKEFNEQKYLKNKTFFYPSSLAIYKNHKVIIQALIYLKENYKKNDYRVCFTLNSQEFKNTYPEQYTEIKKNNLPIKFLGKLSLKEVYEMYSKSVLIFPSYIETFGLPLLEAKESKSPIIAAKTPFSLEILQDYEDVYYFEEMNFKELSEIINNMLKKS